MAAGSAPGHMKLVFQRAGVLLHAKIDARPELAISHRAEPPELGLPARKIAAPR